MIAHKGVKRRLRSRGVSVDVVGEFNGRKVRSPIILSESRCKCGDLFEFLINPFRLTIGLRVISHGEGLIYIQKGTEVVVKVAVNCGPRSEISLQGRLKHFHT